MYSYRQCLSSMYTQFSQSDSELGRNAPNHMPCHEDSGLGSVKYEDCFLQNNSIQDLWKSKHYTSYKHCLHMHQLTEQGSGNML